jgi:hypothetical protein
MRWIWCIGSLLYFLCNVPQFVFSSSDAVTAQRILGERRHPFHSDVCLDLLDSDSSLLHLPLHDIFIIIPIFNLAHPSLLVESVSVKHVFCRWLFTYAFEIGEINSERRP